MLIEAEDALFPALFVFILGSFALLSYEGVMGGLDQLSL